MVLQLGGKTRDPPTHPPFRLHSWPPPEGSQWPTLHPLWALAELTAPPQAAAVGWAPTHLEVALVGLRLRVFSGKQVGGLLVKHDALLLVPLLLQHFCNLLQNAEGTKRGGRNGSVAGVTAAAAAAGTGAPTARTQQARARSTCSSVVAECAARFPALRTRSCRAAMPRRPMSVYRDTACCRHATAPANHEDPTCSTWLVAEARACR